MFESAASGQAKGIAVTACGAESDVVALEETANVTLTEVAARIDESVEDANDTSEDPRLLARTLDVEFCSPFEALDDADACADVAGSEISDVSVTVYVVVKLLVSVIVVTLITRTPTVEYWRCQGIGHLSL